MTVAVVGFQTGNRHNQADQHRRGAMHPSGASLVLQKDLLFLLVFQFILAYVINSLVVALESIFFMKPETRRYPVLINK